MKKRIKNISNAGNKRKCGAILLSAFIMAGQMTPAYAMTDQEVNQVQSALSLAQTDADANSAAIKVLLQQCIAGLPEDDPARTTINSVITLLDSGQANSQAVAALLQSVVDDYGEDAEETSAEDSTEASDDASADGSTDTSDAVSEQTDAESQTGETAASESERIFTEISSSSDGTMPAFEEKSYTSTLIPARLILSVPGEWGNNASEETTLISYSSVNGSGAISPKAGTLTISYFEMEGSDQEASFDEYEQNIANMSVTSNMTSENLSTAALPARKLNFIMNVGANCFTCETICFVYEQTIYAIELMQGALAEYDYFNVFDQVVESAHIGDEQEISDVKAGVQQETTESQTESETEAVTEAETETTTEAVTEGETETTTEAVTEAETETTTEAVTEAETETTTEAVTEAETETETEVTTEAVTETETETDSNSIGSFQYTINGHTYQFPTEVNVIAQEDLPLNREMDLPYDFSSDADLGDVSWTEIINTQYFYFENSLYKEMAGVTNMTGADTTVENGIVTALIDTQGSYVNITLPGEIKVGGNESDIINGFPQFADAVMDGTGYFIGNELLYACNVRDDGCNGYALIRNDAPYYSAVTIICENGIIKEISYECLGSVRAAGVFLEE